MSRRSGRPPLPSAASARAVETLKQAIALHGRDDLVGAEAAYRAAVALDPRQFYALQLLGVLMTQTGRPEEALTQLDAALKLAPRLPDAHVARGDALARLRRFEEAIVAYDSALAIRPVHADSWKCRGVALNGLRRIAEALACYDRALGLKPDFVEVHALRGAALAELRRFDEAYAAIDAALALAPDSATAFVARGNMLFNSGRTEEALTCFERALECSPGEIDGWINRAAALGRLRRFDEAAASFDAALARYPDCAEAMFQRSAMRLLRGDYEGGWQDYESRWTSRQAQHRVIEAPLPIWRGEPLAGQTILIYEEQGYGDMLQFCRYLPELAARGADVTLLVRPALASLLHSLPGSPRIVTKVESFEGFDWQCPLLSLPLAFGTRLDNIPARVPYLAADPQRVAQWKARLGGGFKVGISWAASVQGWRQGRSAPLAEFAGLSRLPDVRLLSLQKEAGVEQLEATPAGMEVETLGPEYEAGDFLETAAVVSALDLVITVDTAIAHLAGALGRPVWVALPYVADWRWLFDRADSPWYPTMRLYRQRGAGHWRSAFAGMEASLRALTAEAA